MRTIRGLAIAIAALVLAPEVGSAQLGRRFENAWFWGFKGTGIVYSTADVTNKIALGGGIEWVITRRRGGLYLSIDHALMTERAQYINADLLPDTVLADVEMKDIRRYNMAAMIFPDLGRWIRPYVGLGASLTQVARVTDLSTYNSPEEQLSTQWLIYDYKAALSPLSIVGVQLRLPLASIFGQATAMATPDRFFLRGGHTFTYSLEAGIRYNIGSSIER
jgi:hypothetical protein